MVGSLTPEIFQKSRGMEKGLNTLNNGAISMLSNSIVGRSVMHGEFLLRAFLF